MAVSGSPRGILPGWIVSEHICSSAKGSDSNERDSDYPERVWEYLDCGCKPSLSFYVPGA
jgi:hypothetical protein